MGHDRLFHALRLLGRLGLCVLLIGGWPRRRAATDQADGQPATRTHRRSTDPQPFPGLTTRPLCAACAHAVQAHPVKPSPAPSLLMTSTRGRRRQVDTQSQCCPEPSCRYYGWIGRGNSRANGHPRGGLWRQLQCVLGGTSVLETHGTLCLGKRVPTALLVRVVAALAEGVCIRAGARGFEVDPHTVLAWLVEATAQLQAFSPYVLHEVQVSPVHLDALFGVLSGVKMGQVSDAAAIQHLERSPH